MVWFAVYLHLSNQLHLHRVSVQCCHPHGILYLFLLPCKSKNYDSFCIGVNVKYRNFIWIQEEFKCISLYRKKCAKVTAMLSLQGPQKHKIKCLQGSEILSRAHIPTAYVQMVHAEAVWKRAEKKCQAFLRGESFTSWVNGKIIVKPHPLCSRGYTVDSDFWYIFGHGLSLYQKAAFSLFH